MKTLRRRSTHPFDTPAATQGERKEIIPFVLHPHGVGRGCKGLKPQQHTLSALRSKVYRSMSGIISGTFKFLLLALLLCGTAQAEVAIPPLKQRVTDLTATFDAAQIQALEARLAAFETGKGAQIAVLMLPSTQPEAIEQFAIRVVEAWKLGRKGVDDGVLLLVAKDDRKLRIEVGYGLEGALNDATAKRIVAEIISPYFKRGEFYAGVDAGVAAIIKVVEGEPLPAPSHTAPSSSAGGLGNFELLFVAGLFVFFIGNLILQQFMGRLPSGMFVAGAIGGLAWVLLASMILAGAVALIAFLASLILGSKGLGSGSSSLPYGFGGGGGWGSSGGGDFGGGGGGFGGGGASGDW